MSVTPFALRLLSESCRTSMITLGGPAARRQGRRSPIGGTFAAVSPWRPLPRGHFAVRLEARVAMASYQLVAMASQPGKADGPREQPGGAAEEQGSG